ncbi:DUF3006 domain-containing protein [Pelotomaculum propionicicum]|uniref:DUF3006 domain-containing protein n=1 Tax=Pelotomaculum propionicicum TaxID=258475 RepID=A0A4Y7RU43_9FIRM|nr:DUF3006 domain-containing protein [Pelotomaculum propionicicum]NLI14111.1 DUF3006 domain-containing protein [Peptococcaceae bacterium]TEB11777.1 hypothetical protein Pmgp_01355 [Pelotomaculum propionicicum]
MLVIDRFEGDWVIVEANRIIFKLPRELLPPEAMEGDVIRLNVRVDPVATARLKNKTDSLARKLFKD